jgi:hypothetical protein
MGFEKVVYTLFNMEDRIREFLKIQEGKDLELIHLAAKAPERIIIISDHNDENLISPKQYE